MNNIEKEKLRIAVIGSGAVGSVFTASLSNAGHEVVVSEVMPKILETLRSQGLQVHGQREWSVKPASVCNGMKVFEQAPFDLVMLILKVPVLSDLAETIAKHDNPNTTYVVACNGLGAEQVLVDQLGPDRVFRMVVNFAAGLDAPGKAHLVAMMGDNLIGPAAPEQLATAETLAKKFSQADLPTHPIDRIQDKVWEKTILNASLSALCAVGRCTMKNALTHGDGFEYVVRTLRECIDVAKANGIALADSYFDEAVAYLQRGGDHYPSLHTDLWERRVLEIDYLNGAIVAAGEEKGVATPYNYALTALVKLLRDCGAK